MNGFSAFVLLILIGGPVHLLCKARIRQKAYRPPDESLTPKEKGVTIHDLKRRFMEK
jgi:hypothetical protein